MTHMSPPGVLLQLTDGGCSQNKNTSPILLLMALDVEAEPLTLVLTSPG